MSKLKEIRSQENWRQHPGDPSILVSDNYQVDTIHSTIYDIVTNNKGERYPILNEELTKELKNERCL